MSTEFNLVINRQQLLANNLFKAATKKLSRRQDKGAPLVSL